MRKKILMVGSSLDVKGGMTTVVEGFIENKFKDSEIIYVPTHIEKAMILQMLFFLRALIVISCHLIFNDIKIVHIHFSEKGSFIRKSLVLKLSKIFNKKVIVHMHGAEFKQFYNYSNNNKKIKIKEFLIESDKVIVLGESWKEFVAKLDDRINIEVMPNFVSCTDASVSFKNNKVNILFLAVLIKRKGIFDLIEAINLILNDNKFSSYEINVIIAGTGEDEKQVIDRVKKLNIMENFEFKGWVGKDEKLKILQNSQLFVLPSYNEGLPVSILEAMSYGLPIISTNVGSIEDAVINDYNGRIINPGDINSLRESIEYLINNKDIWNYFSKNSKHLVERKYDKEKYFLKMEKMYDLI